MRAKEMGSPDEEEEEEATGPAREGEAEDVADATEDTEDADEGVCGDGLPNGSLG